LPRTGHWGHQDTGLYYTGLQHDEIPDPTRFEKNGIHNWTKKGGIVGRGVLIDDASHAQKHNITYSATTRHEITVTDIEAIAEEQGVKFRPADILIIRSGWIRWYNGASEDERCKGWT
jgi:hypothetical protein